MIDTWTMRQLSSIVSDFAASALMLCWAVAGISVAILQITTAVERYRHMKQFRKY